MKSLLNNNNSNSSKYRKSNASQKNGNAMSATNNNTNVASNNENKTSEQSYNTGQENVNTESSNGTETANGNEGYYSTSNTNDLETEKTHSEQSQTVSGGDQHSQLWGNKPEGSILSPQNVENAMNDKNGTNNYNSNGNAGGKEAVINHKTNNDTVSGGKTNAFSNSIVVVQDIINLKMQHQATVNIVKHHNHNQHQAMVNIVKHHNHHRTVLITVRELIFLKKLSNQM